MSESSIWSPGIGVGPPGPPGQAATIQVGTVQTGQPGTNATIINSGTTSDAIFNFVIPRGDTGIGTQGVPGPPGESIQGPPGDPGVKGDPGIQGVPGSAIISGVGIPSNAVGVDGDYFLDQSQAYLYGPKVSGIWPGVFLDLRGGASGVHYGTRTVSNSSALIAKTAATDPTLISNTDYTQVTAIWDALPNGVLRGITQQANSLTVTRAGVYEIMLWASLSASDNNVNVAFKFAVNGTITLIRRPITRLDVLNNISSLCANGLVQLAVGDVITLWLASTVTTNVRIYDAVLSLKEQR